ncbi:MAG: NAD-dependent protein deacylase [Oscillospiraceae bacterium]|jgi:NAD-dependent deacetylase|nr:NAD-dependent protein deacylase [Oscillospiraceae bacterium]
MADGTERLVRLIRNSTDTVFFGGAGVSTESGIPDFRSEKGLYAAQSVYGHVPEELLSHTFFLRDPETFFRYYKGSLLYPDAKPNACHRALAALEQQGRLSAVITQNIDGLHQKAGSKTVWELHGSNERHYCMHCGAKYTLADVMAQEGVPLCRFCGGIIRPDVVLYEENLDRAVMSGAIRALDSANLLIVAGTSLAVYPAAGLLRCFHGTHLVLINKSATPMDSAADLVMHCAVGDVFAAVMELL